MIEPPIRVFHEILAYRATDTPDKTFLVTRARSLTYAEAHAISNTIAHSLIAAGVHRRDRVAVMMPNGIDFILTWFGICKLGAIPVPFNEAYLGVMLQNQAVETGCRVAVLESTYVERWVAIADGLPDLDRLFVHGAATSVVVPDAWAVEAWAVLADGDSSDLPSVVTHRDVMAILYTSGTTGPSKGVMYGYGHAYATARPLGLECEPDDVFYMFLSMFHTGLPHTLGTVLIAGCTMAIREKFSRTQFWADVAYFRATTTLIISTMSSYLLANPPSPDDAMNTLEHVFMSPLPTDIDAFKQRFGLARVATLFNLTEASTPLFSGFALANGSSCGRPRPGMQVRLVDENDEEVPIGEPGELVLRSDEPWELGLGYWGNPEATAASWRNQWMHTGDLLTRDAEGNFYFKDRLKDVIRRRGENVSAWELEMAVNRHPSITECAAVAVPSPMGDDEIKVVAVTSDTTQVGERELWLFLAGQLPAYMVPRYLRVQRQDLPKTSTGKIQKMDLRSDPIDGCWDAEAEGLVVSRAVSR
ncbi:ATP-dependent acyl-CoA ligase [Cryobacterium sp. TMS1-20-1]|uniref:AMP-binding protein n=1 Tax=Cryobacterium sp. TMS1-20-1 TaxID=1259223 RepID=UPI001068E080|nr:AMP-binding protein [Cryobacterium sp. TMS1-20-1]TFC74887.1 ATP-dependent acyl-CoA ligase [Cryobacterium sp. TMS1-20-1]